MQSRRLASAGLSLIAALTFTVAGCNTAGDNTTDAGAATTAPADPKTVLASATTELGTTSFKVNVELGTLGTIDGVMDAAKKTGTMTMKVAAEGVEMNIETILLGNDMYMKMDMGGQSLPGMDAGKWMHLDASRLPADNSLGLKPGEFDPVGAAKFLNAVGDAERSADGTIKGTLDMTKASGAMGITEEDLAEAGAQAKAVPFEAKVDGEGRLTSLVMDIPAMDGQPAQKVKATYSDFGTKVDVAKPPASEVTEAPEMIYDTFKA